MKQKYEDKTDYLIAKYLDGELSGREQRQFEKRLSSDPALREEIRRYGRVDQVLAEDTAQELSEVDYDAQRAEIIGRLERKVLLEGPPRRARLRPILGVLSAAAVIAIAASVLLHLLREPPTVMLPGREEVQVRLVEPQAAAAGSVVSTRARWQGGGARPSPSESGLPRGTVVVSLGSQQGRAETDSPLPTEWIGIE